MKSDYRLHRRWRSIDEIVAKAGDELKLDLGCGFYKPGGYIGLDNLVGERTQLTDEENAPDIIIDLNTQPLPFADRSCSEVRASHFLEHAVLDHVIDEVSRVLLNGGIFRIIVPYASSAEGMYPGHAIFLTEKWFRENRNFASKFEIMSESYRKSEEYLTLPRLVRAVLPWRWARTFLYNACGEMTLVARRRPRSVCG